MKIGYARISTKNQSFSLQVDALEKAGCNKIYKEVISGAKSERKVLENLLSNLREGDTLIVWKLDRLGRSLKHLVELINTLMKKRVGLQSINDPVDTTTAQGRLIFKIFASLAEFEREIIRERTQAGLQAAKERGRVGGRPKGLSKKAQSTACAAEALYKEGKLSVQEIANQLGIAKSTLYNYLRHRNVKIGLN
ncbi:resolvase [Candidatus Uabimicrobium amorphum]|uniref:Resolvase n=1 Tax=Uabimicrobium amorphum TaxID=2596890 RepID=A0A5S9IRL7_UABAM|nr:recombinase family protein [Candidatus Uabimicrobium amorphum]BBM86848.1 resolvase [Candidatus Uabimicrobium amorphum]